MAERQIWKDTNETAVVAAMAARIMSSDRLLCNQLFRDQLMANSGGLLQ